MKTRIKCFVVLLFLSFPFMGKGQEWVADSITIHFGDSISLFSFSDFNVVKAIDHRKAFPAFISVFEQKKGWVFPVDQIVKLQNPLTDALVNRFTEEDEGGENYSVDVYVFSIDRVKAMGKQKLELNSILELSTVDSKDTMLVGSFYYDLSYTIPKHQLIPVAYVSLLEQWSRRFNGDVMAVEKNLDDLLKDNLYHFRRGKQAIAKNFYVEIEFFAGLNFWGLDGELWFSEPEESRIFERNTRVMRYVNHPDFQSIAVGTNVSLWNYRIAENWLFTNKMALLIGFNNWKDMDQVSHKLEEILLFNGSLSQRINYNRFDKKGLVFGLGVMEDFHYIVYHHAKLKIGVSLNCSYKF